MASKHGFFSAALEIENNYTVYYCIKQLMPLTAARWRPSMAFFSAAVPVENQVLEIADRCHTSKKFFPN
jgi:hypothetical protein